MNITGTELLAQFSRAAVEWPFITVENNDYGLPPYLLYAVGSRETNLTNEIGDGGHGHGVWQLDDRSHTIPNGFDNDVEMQCAAAADMLSVLYVTYGDWISACNAYNSGSPLTSDTTGMDYGPDVIERQNYLTANVLDYLASLGTGWRTNSMHLPATTTRTDAQVGIDLVSGSRLRLTADTGGATVYGIYQIVDRGTVAPAVTPLLANNNGTPFTQWWLARYPLADGTTSVIVNYTSPGGMDARQEYPG